MKMVEVTIYLIKAIFTPMMKFFSLSLPLYLAREACVWNFTHTHKNKASELLKRFLNQIWCGLSVCRRVQNRCCCLRLQFKVHRLHWTHKDTIQLIHFISFRLAVFQFFHFFQFSSCCFRTENVFAPFKKYAPHEGTNEPTAKVLNRKNTMIFFIIERKKK